MLSTTKKTSFSWLRIMGAIGIIFCLVLSAGLIWYQVAVETPAVNLLQSETLTEESVVSTLIRISSPASEHAVR